MPTLVLGLIPAVVGIFLNDGFWFGFGVLMIIGGGGDILCVGKILMYRSEATDRLYLDHPYEIGTIIFER